MAPAYVGQRINNDKQAVRRKEGQTDTQTNKEFISKCRPENASQGRLMVGFDLSE